MGFVFRCPYNGICGYPLASPVMPAVHNRLRFSCSDQSLRSAKAPCMYVILSSWQYWVMISANQNPRTLQNKRTPHLWPRGVARPKSPSIHEDGINSGPKLLPTSMVAKHSEITQDPLNPGDKLTPTLNRQEKIDISADEFRLLRGFGYKSPKFVENEIND